jgi:hypothetical protein
MRTIKTLRAFAFRGRDVRAGLLLSVTAEEAAPLVEAGDAAFADDIAPAAPAAEPQE